jgi:hypothetical protein
MFMFTLKSYVLDNYGREAWKTLGDMAKLDAMQQYVLLVSSFVPNWEQHVQEELSSSTDISEDSEGGTGKGGGGGPTVSVLARTEENLKDEEKSLFDWCKEGNVEKIRELLNPDNINHQDEDGLTLMHWASDRGHSTVVRLLVERGANLNIQDVDGQAPLHYASSCGHQDIVTFLIAAGADVNIKDNNLDTPRAVAMDTSIERLFA